MSFKENVIQSTALTSIAIATNGKYSENPFRNCLYLFCNTKVDEDMNFSKTGTKTLTFGLTWDLLQRGRERERDKQNF